MKIEQQEAIGRRTQLDFSMHELTIIDQQPFLMHWLKIPGSSTNNIKYINTGGILAVTGDFGNWIFCREFHPSPDGHVSDGYWIEKLEIASTQKGEEFDKEHTQAQLESLLNGGLEEYGWAGKQLEEMREWVERCLENIDDEYEYTTIAYREYPSFTDHESAVFVKKTQWWLKAVFDGFEEICRRMKEKKSTNA